MAEWNQKPPKKVPYVPYLMLRVGQRVAENKEVGARIGSVTRAITSKRYWVDFGKGNEAISSNRVVEV